ncbi:hypothetical protein Tco_0831254 [Tanacetum coccineum]
MTTPSECNSNYEKEAATATSATKSSTVLPFWLHPFAPSSNYIKENLIEMHGKWNKLCQSLHRGRHNVNKRTCSSVQKLLSMIIKLDSSKKSADMDGLTTRIDGTRAMATLRIFYSAAQEKVTRSSLCSWGFRTSIRLQIFSRAPKLASIPKPSTELIKEIAVLEPLAVEFHSKSLRSCHSQPPSMMEYAHTSSNIISLVEHLGTGIKEHVPTTPNKL